MRSRSVGEGPRRSSENLCERKQAVPNDHSRCVAAVKSPRAAKFMVKSQCLEIPSYDAALTSCQSTSPIRASLDNRRLIGSDDTYNVVDDGPILQLSPGASTVVSECVPDSSDASQRLVLSEAFYARMSDVPVLRNTYLFDHRSGAGFISIPHLGNHACTTALGIFRVIENWIEEKLFTYTPVGHDGEEFVPILEENVRTSALGVVRKLGVAAKAFTGLSSVAVHIRSGHVYTLEGSEDLVAGDEAEHFFQQFPLFVDVSLQFRRSAELTGVSFQFQPSDAAQTRPSACRLRMNNPLTESSLSAAESTAESYLGSPHSTCLVVKMSSDIKQHEVDPAKSSSVFERSEAAKYQAPSAIGPGDVSLASSRTIVPPSRKECASPRSAQLTRHSDSCQQLLGSRCATPVFDDGEVVQISPNCTDLDEYFNVDFADSISTANEGEYWPDGGVEKDRYVGLQLYSETSSLSFQPAAPAVFGGEICRRSSREGVSCRGSFGSGYLGHGHYCGDPASVGQQRVWEDWVLSSPTQDAGPGSMGAGDALVANQNNPGGAHRRPRQHHHGVLNSFAALCDERNLMSRATIGGDNLDVGAAVVDVVEDRYSATVLTRVTW